MREPGMLQSTRSQRVGHDLVTQQKQQIIPRIVFLFLGIFIYTFKDITFPDFSSENAPMFMFQLLCAPAKAWVPFFSKSQLCKNVIQSFVILTSLPCFSHCGKSNITGNFNYFHFNTSFIDFLYFPRQKVNFLTFKDFPKQHVFQCVILCQLWSFQFITCCLEIKGLKQKYSLLIHYFWRIGIT